MYAPLKIAADTYSLLAEKCQVGKHPARLRCKDTNTKSMSPITLATIKNIKVREAHHLLVESKFLMSDRIHQKTVSRETKPNNHPTITVLCYAAPQTKPICQINENKQKNICFQIFIQVKFV